MKNDMYCVCGAIALALAACADDNGVAGTSTEPNTVAEVSSSSAIENSSGSNFGLSSSTALPKTSSSVETTSSSAKTAGSSSFLSELQSSSSMVPPVLSSSSSFQTFPSSIYYPPVLCKVSAVGGCAGVHGSGDLWDPDKDAATVMTNKYADDSTKFGIDAGKWFWDADSVDGGKSTILWNTDDEYGGSLDSAVAYAWAFGGIAGVARLDKGGLTYNPFVSVGFYVAGFDSNGVALSADITNWNGICIAYQSDVAPSLELDLGDSLNKELNWALPSVSLRRASFGYGESKCATWDQFKMPSWSKNYKYKISGEEAAKRVVGIRFRLQATPRDYRFNIMAIGSNRDDE